MPHPQRDDVGLVSGLVGTAFPVPIIGTVVGGCLGAFLGSLIGDLWAALGRFWGTISKLSIGALIMVILALAAFF
jgi:hypothetical protein